MSDKSTTPIAHLTSAEDDLHDRLEALRSDVRDWQAAENQGTRKLWSAIARVYELSAAIDENEAQKLKLSELVTASEAVRQSNRWSAQGKSATELLLALMLGVGDESKSRKSQIRVALRTAKSVDVPATYDACLAWLGDVGGYTGARKLANARVQRSVSSVAALMDRVRLLVDATDTDETFAMPRKVGESEFPERIGLVLVQTGDDGMALPLAAIADPKLIATAIRKIVPKSI